jgi:3'-phosphoadenosine 5'-phosphosulfate sulfotransferase (PAPS reductase)/FAD synthetase
MVTTANKAVTAALTHGVDLASYDYIVVSSSAGKDSQVALDVVVRMARLAGVLDRVIVCHADLGRMEWAGTAELVKEQADHYGLPTVIVSREGTVSDGRQKWAKCGRSGAQSAVGIALYEAGEERGDILDQCERRGLQLRSQGKLAAGWNSPASPWCQSDHKIGPIVGYFTELARGWKKSNPETAKVRPCRILDIQGIRGEESSMRDKRPVMTTRKSNRNQHVDTWLPIHAMLETEVWDYIKGGSCGTRYHWAYDEGMPRLSCCFCMHANYDAMLVSGHHNPELLAEFVRVENVLGTRYVQDLRDKKTGRRELSMADIQADLAAGCEIPEVIEGWVCPAA